MKISEVYNRLEELADISSTNEKVDLLKVLLADGIFYKVIKYALDPTLHYNLKNIGVWCMGNTYGCGITADDLFNTLDDLAAKSGTSDKDKENFIKIWSISYNIFEVGRRIINKDLRCGVSAKTVNKAVPGSIKVIPYQRCSTVSKIDKITYPAIIQTKMDSMFSYASVTFLDMFMTRRGKTFGLFDLLEVHMDEWFDALDEYFPSPVFMGELIVVSKVEGEYLDRKTSNGILNKFIKGTGTEEEADRVRYVIWDIVSAEDWNNGFCKDHYSERWSILSTLGSRLQRTKVSTVYSRIVHSYGDAMNFYKTVRGQGEEGAILKDLSSIWKSNTCTTMVKLKNVSTAEFEIIGVNRGTGKYSNRMGSLTVTTSDRGIITNVGSGFTDAERDLEFWFQSIGNIISVNFESVIESKTERKVKKLFLPIFNETRFEEKTEADTTLYCINI